MNRISTPLVLSAGLLVGLLANACSSDDGPAVTPGACDSIIDACHSKDDGSNEVINNCHSTAHEGTDADCSPELQACLDACNAAPDVGTGGHETESHGSEESGHAHESTGATSGHDSSGGSSGHDHGTTTGHDSGTTAGTTAADDSSQASCDELGTICHDTADELGMMCHDVGHAGDEAACAKVWVECIEHCTA